MNKKNIRWWDIPAAIFLIGALFSAAVRLHLTNWTENLGRLEFTVLLAAVIGFALAKSAFGGRTTFIIGLSYSIFFIPWLLGLTMPDMDWNARMTVIYARLWYAVADFLANRPVKDPILFVTTMMMLYWFASLLATYRLVRHANPWLPLLSLGGMLLVIEYTVEMYRNTQVSGAIYSFFFLVFSLLLLGRIYFLRSRKEWESRGGTVEMEVGYDLGRGVAVAALAVVLLAWNTPRIINLFDSHNPARERVSQEWQSLRDRVSKAVNTLRSPNQQVVEGYGSSMPLGTGGGLTDSEIFTVASEFGPLPQRLYWSARTYDQYRNGQWQTTLGQSQDIGPGDLPIVYPAWTNRQEVHFTFTTRAPLLRTLYFTNEILNLSHAAQAIVDVADDGATDVNAVVMDPPLESGNPYIVTASIPQPSVLAMREAGEEYPDWIVDRYLQLPASFSPRIAEQARQIAGGEETPYDKAMAVTQYLRRTITYTETVPTPPANRDPIEWFLFDQRAGFCNYYASAEVLMLRSLGVPARMVVGFAQGTWEPDRESYVVLSKDSHAWPEIYFPGLGWVPFEPTVSQPQTVYPAGTPLDEQPPGVMQSLPSAIEDSMLDMGEVKAERVEDAIEQSSLQRGLTVIRQTLTGWNLALLIVVVVGGLLVFLEWRRRRAQDLPLPSWLEKTLDERGINPPDWLRMWSRRALRTPMENLFANVGWMLRVWGQKIDPALTPAEQVYVLINTVPGVKRYAMALLDEYHRAMYSPYPANIERAKSAVNEMRSVGYRNWIMHLVGLETQETTG